MSLSPAKVYAALIVALIVAFASLGIAAYNIHRIGQLIAEQREASSKLDTLSQSLGAINSSIARLSSAEESRAQALRSEVEAVKSLVDQLSSRLESLSKTQEVQGSNITALRSELAELSRELARLEDALGGQARNVTALARELSQVESRIDNLYSLLLYPVTITDATGKPVTLPSRPTRIVSLLPSVTEILWAVNASKQVIAVDEYSNYPPEVVEEVKNGTLVNIGSGWYPDVERILALRPDLVIGVDSVVSHHTLKSILAEYGIPVILLPDKNFKDVIDSILIVGRATGHPAEAARLAARLEEEATHLRAYIDWYLNETGSPRVRVALIVWVNPLWVAGSETFQNDVLLLAGGVNAYANVTGWKPVSPESLLAVDPDVIIITAGHQGLNMTRQQFIDILKKELGDAVYNITAVRENRIYFVSGDYNDILVRPAPRIVEGATLLAAILYPEAFNLTPSQIPAQVNPETFKIPKIPSTPGH